MSGLTPQNSQKAGGVRVDLDVNFEAFDKGVDGAVDKADKAGKKAGDGFKKNLAATLSIMHALGAAFKSTYRMVDASISRIEAASGPDAPAVKAFRDMQTSLRGAVDGMVESLLSSSTAQRAMEGLSSAFESAGMKLAGLGDSIDTYVREHAPALVAAGDLVLYNFEALRVGWSVVASVFKGLVHEVTRVAGVLAQALAGIVGMVGAVAQAVGIDGLGKALDDAAVKVGAFGAGLVDAAGASARQAWDELGDALTAGVDASIERLGDLQTRWQAFIDGIVSGSRGGRRAGDLAEEDGPGRAVLGAVQSVAEGTEEIFRGATTRIAGMFHDLGDNMKIAMESGTRASLHAAGSLFEGVSALGVQMERSFGRSNTAAKIFQRVQLGLQAVYATVRGLMEAAEAKSQAGSGNFGATALHALSAAAFFSAAGLAGAQAAGVVGGSGAGRFEPQADIRAEDQVVQRTTNITIVVEGNLIESRDYVRQVLVPALRDLVENEDVVLTSTHSRTADQVGGL